MPDPLYPRRCGRLGGDELGEVLEQLRRMGIQGELHTLATRNHCFQARATPGTGSYTWLERIWDFLTQKGFNK